MSRQSVTVAGYAVSIKYTELGWRTPIMEQPATKASGIRLNRDFRFVPLLLMSLRMRLAFISEAEWGRALYTIHESLSNILLSCLSRFALLATRRHAMFTALFPIPMAFRISPTEQNNAAAPRADRHSRGILRDTSRLLQCAVVVPCFHCIISVRCCQ